MNPMKLEFVSPQFFSCFLPITFLEIRLRKRLEQLIVNEDGMILPIVIVCIIGAVIILLMAAVTYFCLRKNGKQRHRLHSIATSSY